MSGRSEEAVARSGDLPGDWDDLVRGCASAEFTQTSLWLECARRCYPGVRLVVWAVRRDGVLVAGLAAVGRRRGAILHLDSSLEGTSGGPLVLDSLDGADRARLFRLLAERLADERRGPLTALGLSLCPDQEREFGPVMRPLKRWRRREASTAAVSLAGGLVAVELERLGRNKRNERNRGLRRGAAVFGTQDPYYLERFYPLYLRAAAHWGVEPVPESFMRGLLEAGDDVDRPGSAYLICVTLEGRVIGAHLNLHLGDRVLAWTGVTDPAFARTHFPSTLCIWGDLAEACERDARWLDLGASDVAGSLLTFKKFFGAELQERGHYTGMGSALSMAHRMRDRLRAHRARPRLRWHDKEPRNP